MQQLRPAYIFAVALAYFIFATTPLALAICSIPTVTSVSPASGSTSGGVSVTITGTNFACGGTLAVKFGGTVAFSTLASATQIIATSPSGVGTVDVTVTTDGGISGTSTADQYTYVASRPTITSISPNIGSVSGGTIVTISGNDFTGATLVKFGNADVALFTVLSSTLIAVSSPAGNGTVDVTVTTPGGTSATNPADQFTYMATAPTVTSISPSSGPTTGATSVIITGTNFTDATAVKFGTNDAPSFNIVSATSIAATSPAGSIGNVDITVTTPSGTSATSSADQFTYAATAAAAAPTVTSISPSSGPTTGATSVTITGTNFTGATAVKFGTANAGVFTVNNATQITATSPAGSAGKVDVTVTTSAGTSATSAADQFTYAIPVDSQNIRTVQINITRIIAATSLDAIFHGIEGGIQDGLSENGSPTTVGPTGAFVSINDGPRSEIATRADEAFASLDYARNKNRSMTSAEDAFGPLGYAGNINKAPAAKGPPRSGREWSAWADIRGTGWKVNDASGNGNDIKGGQINVTAGIGRKLTPDTLVGIVVGYENFKYDVASLNGSLKGNGGTIGGYFARRFGGNLRFDAGLAWTNLNYSATAGTATGSFNAGRWLASTGLSGNYKFNVYRLEPSAKLYAMWEQEKAWTDSLGTLQTARNFSAGRTALGSQVSRPFASSSRWTITPYAGLYGDWRFSSDNAIATAGTPVAFIKNGWSGRVTGGVSATAMSGCTIAFGGEYGGLGANYKVWSGNIRAALPF